VLRLISRRVVLRRAAVAIVAVPALASGEFAADAKSKTRKAPESPAKPAVAAGSKTAAKSKSRSSSLKAFRLVTGCGVNGGCSCKACQAHATNKFFASRTDVVRAHRGCNCQITTESLPRDTWIALFGLPERPTTTGVDKRDPRVQEILSHVPPHQGHGGHHHH
jgi:hypothetical protein